MNLEILEIEMAGLFTLEEISLLKTVLLKAESVLLERNLKSFTRRCWYKLWLLVTFFALLLKRPLLTRSIP